MSPLSLGPWVASSTCFDCRTKFTDSDSNSLASRKYHFTLLFVSQLHQNPMLIIIIPSSILALRNVPIGTPVGVSEL